MSKEILLKRIENKTIFPIVEDYDTEYYLIGLTKKDQNKLRTIPMAPLCKEDVDILKCEGYKFPSEMSEIGTILIRNPFRPFEFVSIDTSQDDLIKGHLSDMAAIFLALGAEECNESAAIFSKETLNVSGDGEVNVKKVKVKGLFSLFKKFEKRNDISLNIVGKSKYQSYKDRYEAAQQTIKKYRLLGIKTIEDVMELFDPITGNRPPSYNYKEELTTELHKRIKGSLEIKAMGMFDFNGKIDVKQYSYENLKIEKTIKFSPTND